jgi:hypothetical protein
MTKAGSSRLNLRANRAVRLASRGVERQQFVSTMKLVDTLAEQEELERSSRRASQPHGRPRDRLPALHPLTVSVAVSSLRRKANLNKASTARSTCTREDAAIANTPNR